MKFEHDLKELIDRVELRRRMSDRALTSCRRGTNSARLAEWTTLWWFSEELDKLYRAYQKEAGELSKQDKEREALSKVVTLETSEGIDRLTSELRRLKDRDEHLEYLLKSSCTRLKKSVLRAKTAEAQTRALQLGMAELVKNIGL